MLNLTITKLLIKKNFFGTLEHVENVCERYIAEKPEDYIIGGRPAKPEEYPWMVMTLVMRHKTSFSNIFRGI